MTRFIDVKMISQLVAQVGIARFMQQMAAQIQHNFMHWQEFEKSARLASHSDIGVIELMPVSNAQCYGYKYVNGHPSNSVKGLPTVMAYGALADVATGYPTFLSELTITTAFRTAATSAMAAKILARPDAKKMAMIGCGAQSEFQALAFNCLLGINELAVFDIDSQAMEKLQRNLSAYKQLTVSAKHSVNEAVAQADIITTVTADKKQATILTADSVAAGTHINALGGDCPGKIELDKNLLTAAEIFVEYEPQTRVEGDIQQLAKNYPVTELWRCLVGEKTARDNNQQITVFDSVGFALEDFSVSQYLQKLSAEYGIGEDIQLVPDLADPKDLYSLLLDSSGCSVIHRAA